MKHDSIIGFDLGGTNSKLWHNNKEDIICADQDLSSAEEQAVVSILKKYTSTDRHIKAIGVAISATLVPEGLDRRIIDTSSKFGGFAKGRHRGIIGAMEAAWGTEVGIPVFILNDGEAASFDAKAYLQERRGRTNYRNVLILTLGTSVGAGFIFDRKPYIGPYPSKASHIILEPRGDWCTNDTHRGCWKTLVGESSRRALALKMGLHDEKNESLGMSMSRIAAEARKGSKRARLFFMFLAEDVARGIGTIINVIPVQCVIVAGGVARAGRVLMDPLKQRLRKGDFVDPDLVSQIDIIRADKLSVARGAYRYAHDQIKL